MGVLKAAGAKLAAVFVAVQFLGVGAGAATMPLPERNPARVPPMPLPERNPIRVTGLPLPERNPMREPPAPVAHATPQETPPATDETRQILPDPNKWSDEEIAAERARCEEVLKGLPVVTEPDDPVRQGECGAVAPVTLISVGSDPAIRLVPPATVTCDMAAAMAKWVTKDVQPTARKLLGAPITRMNIIGHYSCRNALGRTSRRLSEHGLANALDIRDFVTEKGETIDLTRDWGPTARDIAARVAAEKAAEVARKAAAVAAAEAAKKAAKDAAPKVTKIATQDPDPKAAATGSETPRQPSVTTKGTVSASASGGRLSRADQRKARRDARRLRTASRLGGPAVSAGEGITAAAPAKKSVAAVPPVPPKIEEAKPTPRRLFLRQVHWSACGVFGTVLGPEANEAHRNHFHVDMAPRRHRSYCE